MSISTMDIRIGEQFAGYRIARLIGHGGMGVVYLAEDPRLERRVALKILMPALASNAAFRSRFERESRLAASLDHPHIIPVYEAGEAGGLLYLAMRYVEGKDLKELLKEGPLALERTVAIVEQVAEALDVAHARELVHRDVKPGNILVADRADQSSPECCYLCDFGLTVRASGSSDLTGSGQVWGTGDYLAPEQIHGEQVDGRTDIYALGCVLYECVTGQVPFPREHEVAVMFAHLSQPPPSASAARPRLPTGIDAVIATAMAKEREDRYATCSALAADARAVLLGKAASPPFASAQAAARIPSPALPGFADGVQSPPAPLTRPRRRTSLVVAAALIGVLAAIAAALLLVANLTPQKHTADSSLPSPTRPLVTFAVGKAPFRLAVGDGSIWVALGEVGRQQGNPVNAVSQIDSTTGQVLQTITLRSAENDIAFGEGSVWVSNGDEGTVSQIDPALGKVVRTIPVGLHPAAVAVGEGGIWVANGGDGTVSRIDPRTNEVVATIVTLAKPSSIVVGAGAVWVAHSADNSLVRIDPASNAIQAVISLSRPVESPSGNAGVATTPVGMAFYGGTVWVTEANGFLETIDTATNQVTDRIALRFDPAGVAVGPEGMWLINQHHRVVLRLRLGTAEVLEKVVAGRSPRDIAMGASGVWVVNLWDGTISQVGP